MSADPKPLADAIPPGPAILFCPADRPDRYDKALAAADSVVIDLEDAVAPDAKTPARSAVVEALGRLPLDRVIVRVNALDSSWAADDLAALADTDVRTLMIPKAEDPDRLAELDRWNLVALCETSRGVLEAPRLAAAPTCVAMFWGAEDLTADLGGRRSRGDDGDYLPVAVQARTTVLLAAAAARVQAWDSVYLDIADHAGLLAEAEQGADMGFAAKVSIHPAQMPVIRQAYAPSPDRIDWALDVIAAVESAGGGVTRFQGRMVDEPLIAQARRILTAAERLAPEPLAHAHDVRANPPT